MQGVTGSIPVVSTTFGLCRKARNMRIWRNWQTRMVQVHVKAISWRFKSSYPHHENSRPDGLLFFIYRYRKGDRLCSGILFLAYFCFFVFGWPFAIFGKENNFIRLVMAVSAVIPAKRTMRRIATEIKIKTYNIYGTFFSKNA